MALTPEDTLRYQQLFGIQPQGLGLPQEQPPPPDVLQTELPPMPLQATDPAAMGLGFGPQPAQQPGDWAAQGLGFSSAPAPEQAPAPVQPPAPGLAGDQQRVQHAQQMQIDAAKSAQEDGQLANQIDVEEAAKAAALEAEREKQEKQFDAIAKEKAARHVEQLKALTEAASKSTDPTRFWNDRGAVHKATGFIAAFMGGFLAPVLGHNPTSKIIDDAISRDIDAQHSEQQMARQKIADAQMLNELGIKQATDEKGQRERGYLVRKVGILAEMKKKRAGLKDGILATKYDQTIADIEADVTTSLNGIEQQKYNRTMTQQQMDAQALQAKQDRALRWGSLKFQKDEAARDQSNKDRARIDTIGAQEAAGKAAAQEAASNADVSRVYGISGGHDGNSIKFSNSPADVKKRDELRGLTTSTQQVLNSTNRLKQLLTADGREAYGATKEEAKQEAARIVAALMESNKGAASEGDVNRNIAKLGFIADENGIVDVTKFFDGEKVSTKIKKLTDFAAATERTTNTTLKGYDPSWHFEEYSRTPEPEKPKELDTGDMVLKLQAQTTPDDKIQVGEELVSKWSGARPGAEMLHPFDPKIGAAINELSATVGYGPKHLHMAGDVLDQLNKLYNEGSPNYVAAEKKINVQDKLRERARKLGLTRGPE